MRTTGRGLLLALGSGSRFSLCLSFNLSLSLCEFNKCSGEPSKVWWTVANRSDANPSIAVMECA